MAPTNNKEKSSSWLPDTFFVCFMEMLTIPILNVFLYFFMKNYVWSNDKYVNILNNGWGPFYHGYQCGDKIEDSGYYIFIACILVRINKAFAVCSAFVFVMRKRTYSRLGEVL